MTTLAALGLLVTLAILGVIGWALQALPMPEPFRVLIIAVVVIVGIAVVARAFGVPIFAAALFLTHGASVP